MLDVAVLFVIEAGKAFFGEMGKAGARALFPERPQAGPVPQPEPVAQSGQIYNPVADAQAVGESFLSALVQQDHDAAWALCDPEWPYDPERSQSYDETFGAAPPISWAVRQIHVPEDWTAGNVLSWAGLEVLVTFDLQDGSYSTLQGILWIFNINGEWRIADINWDPDGSRAAAAEETFESSLYEMFKDSFSYDEPASTKRVIVCTRCPQKLSIPVGVGRIRVKCPACWTTQVVDS